MYEGKKLLEAVTSPGQKHLRNVNDISERLNDKRMEVFHSVVAKLMWIVKRARPGLEIALSSYTHGYQRAM